MLLPCDLRASHGAGLLRAWRPAGRVFVPTQCAHGCSPPPGRGGLSIFVPPAPHMGPDMQKVLNRPSLTELHTADGETKAPSLTV